MFFILNYSKIVFNSESDGEYDWVKTEFEETVKMSTYLVGLVISDLLCRPTYYNSKLSNQTIAIDICVRSNAIDQTDLAFDSSVPLLEFFEDNFQIQYFMPKLGKKIKIIQHVKIITNIHYIFFSRSYWCS